MTEKQALILSIYKYNWFVDNPEETRYPNNNIDSCALCTYDAKFLDDCSRCPMFGIWPTTGDDSMECDSDEFSIWKMWGSFSMHPAIIATRRRRNIPMITSYDRAFFALVLVEAFHDKLQELYRRK